jgi:chromosome segregation ATPase
MPQPGEIIYKTRDDARARGNGDGTAARSVADDLDYRFEAFAEGIAQAMSEYVREEISPLRRELDSLKFEVVALREERKLQRELEGLRLEVAEACKQVPNVPAIARDLKAETARLREELAATQKKLLRLRTDWSQTDYAVGELRKKTEAAAAASVEVEFESSSTHFQMKAAHPDAARALKEFAAEIVSGSADGTIWLPGAGTQ